MSLRFYRLCRRFEALETSARRTPRVCCFRVVCATARPNQWSDQSRARNGRAPRLPIVETHGLMYRPHERQFRRARSVKDEQLGPFRSAAPIWGGAAADHCFDVVEPQFHEYFAMRR